MWLARDVERERKHRWQDADNREGLATDDELAADHSRIAEELHLPELMRHHDDA
jgi:hypothetical protein